MVIDIADSCPQAAFTLTLRTPACGEQTHRPRSLETLPTNVGTDRKFSPFLHVINAQLNTP